MKIRYVMMAGRNGYAEFARYFVAALHQAGHDVAVHQIAREFQAPETLGWKGLLSQKLTRPMRHPDVNIVNTGAGDFAAYRAQGAMNLGFTMFETSRMKPERVAECNEMDGILAPSTFCAKVFRDSGVTIPIHVVNPGIFRKDVPDPETPKAFNFLSIFQWSDRKDPETLIRSFLQEFDASEKVSLTLKTYPFGPMPPIEDQLKKLHIGKRQYPKIHLVTDTLHTDEIWRLHANSSCHVSAHHGEGWGMSLMDAMACGKPVIATGYGGNTDFMCPDNSYLLPFKMERARFTNEGMKPHYDSSMHWAAVAVPDLRAKMRGVFEHQQEARSLGAKARADILERFTPDRSTKMIESAVKSIGPAWKKTAPVKKACLVQCASGPFVKNQQRVFDWHSDYCVQHDIDYLLHIGRIPTQLSRHAIWDRLPLLRSALGYGYDLVIWLDTDALVVDPETDLRDAAREFADVGMVRHDSHFNNGVMFLRNTSRTDELLRATDELGPIPHPIWKIQASVLAVDEKLQVIEPIDDRWNSTEGVNESQKPVIRAWHGQGHNGREKLLEVLRALP